MKLKALLAALVLAAFAVSCDQETPTTPIDDPVFARGGIPGPPGGTSPDDGYRFEYLALDEFDNDCEKKSPESEFGKTFWCYGETPTFVLRVVNSDGPVTIGTVTFKRCVDYRNDEVQPWYRCGVHQGKNKRYYGGEDYGDPAVINGQGLAALTLDATWDEASSVWGMHWEYDSGDGKKPEAAIKWRDLAYVGHRDPP